MNVPLSDPRPSMPESGRRRLLGRSALAVGALGLMAAGAGCATSDISRYRGERPTLDLRRYFNGIVDAWGVFQNRSGDVVRRFTVVMNCNWNGDVGTLDEDFVYSDGEKQKRIWTIRRFDDGRYEGRADDVIGIAQGTAAGNALNWRYALRLPVDGSTYEVDFDDWMYQIDDRVMLNRAVMSKYGIRLGEVLLSFTRRS